MEVMASVRAHSGYGIVAESANCRQTPQGPEFSEGRIFRIVGVSLRMSYPTGQHAIPNRIEVQDRVEDARRTI